MKIENVAIFGGNGSVGALTSAIIAGFGEANVYLICRDKRKINEEVIRQKIYKSIKSDIISSNLFFIDYDEAVKILKTCDWIFECVKEDYDVKNKVLTFINENASDNALITTVTSGLSINKLSENFSDSKKKNFFGTHFFNPPYNMTLCEVIMSEYNCEKQIKSFSNYLENKLLRKVVYSKDKAAFIANKIGFKILNDLLILADLNKDNGGIDYIDSLFGGYTGRSMKPLTTINFVGLDVHKAIVDNIKNNSENIFEDEMILPPFFYDLIKNGNLGLKVNSGLYQDKENVYDIKNNCYRAIKIYNNKTIIDINKHIRDGRYEEAYKILFDSKSKEMELVKKVLITYVIYSIIISSETSDNIASCDVAMANGFGWCPPLALKELIEKVCDFNKNVDKYIPKEIIKKYKIYDILAKTPKSKYNYEKYIRAN